MAKLGEYGDKLPTMTEQEVFNVAVTHLLEQGEKSEYEKGNCVYNGPEGLCCAAAPFIEDYDPNMEGKSWYGLTDSYCQSHKHSTLIKRLQDIHDDAPVSVWPSNLSRMAYDFGLEEPQILKDHLNIS